MTQPEPLSVLSLGWGVQSWTLAAMAVLGELPQVAVAVHADTGYERRHTYDLARRWTPWLKSRGIRVITCQAPEKDRAIFNPQGGVDLPFFTLRPDGSKGQVPRQCTRHWKVWPVRRVLQQIRAGRPVDLLLGISRDEWSRMRDSDVRYIRHIYPLVDKGMSRADCVDWLTDHGLEVPQKSSCTFCPYHNKGNNLVDSTGPGRAS